MSNTGSASIICGPSGEKVRAHYVPHGGHLSNGQHALFTYPLLVEVCVHRGGGHESVEIIRHQVDQEEGKYVSKTLYLTDPRPHPEDIPEYVGKFREAYKAALEKESCYHCREPHYYIEKEVKTNE